MNENFGIAKRDNNPRRDFLIVNKFQSKHYPSDPRDTVANCSEMGEEMLRVCPDGKCLAIVFAETAVGIGALAASALGERCFLISTTREELPDFCEHITFEETHSHAPLHKLRVRRDVELSEFGHIFIIDDELTTGNTVKALAEKLMAANLNIPISAHVFAASHECMTTLGNIGVKVYAKYTYDMISSIKFPTEFSADESERLRSPDLCVDLNSVYDIRHGVQCDKYFDECARVCDEVLPKLTSAFPKAGSIEVIGTEEDCLPSILLGNLLAERGFEVRVHGVTRSPILPSGAEDYPIKTRSVLRSLYDSKRTVFLYNKVECDLSVIITDAEAPDERALKALCGACGGTQVAVVRRRSSMRTSLKESDCKLLLKDITGRISPMNAAERAEQLRRGVHYCELLPEEFVPSVEYIRLYEAGLAAWGRDTALAVQSVSEQILRDKGRDVVIVSLARAGTPIGVLIKRYLKRVHGISAAHYSVSIIRGRGIDKAAMEYILVRHGAERIQFVDGWTGKGAITRQLAEALADFPETDCRPAVLADPAGVCEIYGTREDVFIPCSCLSSTVSGLFSRTVLRDDLIASGDFHGAVYFGEFSAHDRTYEFIEAIEREMSNLPPYSPEECAPPLGEGLEETRRIAEEFDVPDLNLVKPSIGEATRVLLRRTPELILVRDIGSPLTKHLVELAREKNVPVREYPMKCYRAAGIIRN